MKKLKYLKLIKEYTVSDWRDDMSDWTEEIHKNNSKCFYLIGPGIDIFKYIIPENLRVEFDEFYENANIMYEEIKKEWFWLSNGDKMSQFMGRSDSSESHKQNYYNNFQMLEVIAKMYGFDSWYVTQKNKLSQSNAISNSISNSQSNSISNSQSNSQSNSNELAIIKQLESKSDVTNV